MFIYIDESGDTGLQFKKSSSSHFVVVAIIIRDEHDRARILRTIKRFRKDYKLADHYELKFNKLKKKRVPFLQRFAQSPFRIRAMIVDKTQSTGTPVAPFEYIQRLLLENLPDIKGAKVVIDGQIDRKYKQKAGSYFRSLNKNKNNLKIKIRNSKNVQLIQLADVIAGSLLHSVSDSINPNIYEEIIKHKIDRLTHK